MSSPCRSILNLLPSRRSAWGPSKSPCSRAPHFQSSTQRLQRQGLCWGQWQLLCDQIWPRSHFFAPWSRPRSSPTPLMTCWTRSLASRALSPRDWSLQAWSRPGIRRPKVCVTTSTSKTCSFLILCLRTTTCITLLSLGSTCLPSWLGVIRERTWCTKRRSSPKVHSEALLPGTLETRSWGSILLAFHMHTVCLTSLASPAQKEQLRSFHLSTTQKSRGLEERERRLKHLGSRLHVGCWRASPPLLTLVRSWFLWAFSQG